MKYETNGIEANLNREIVSIWESDELRREKPTPIDEAKAGLAVVENVLWHAGIDLSWCDKAHISQNF